jgi:hypothetical protein
MHTPVDQPSRGGYGTAVHEVKGMPTSSMKGDHQMKGAHQQSNWVPIFEQPIHTSRKLRLACIGAGYAGLMMAYKIKYQMEMEQFVDLRIYEKNSDVGGTWLENRYPGVAWLVYFANVFAAM